jgi:haloacetate dehalogenase
MTARTSTARSRCRCWCLWGEKSHVHRSYKPIEAWQACAADVRGKALPCGHYPAEQVPDETYAELRAFFG